MSTDPETDNPLILLKSSPHINDSEPSVAKRKKKHKNGISNCNEKKTKSAKKRKNTNNSESEPSDQPPNHDIEIDEILLNAKKKKLNDNITKEDVEENLFTEPTNPPLPVIIETKLISKHNRNSKLKKKKQCDKVLNFYNNFNNRTPVNGSAKGNNLRERMLERLRAAQFRYLNEKLYTSSGSEAKELFQSDPKAFQVYHEGYQQQLSKWPVKPLDVIVKKILKLPKTHLIADMGCGEALLSQKVPNTVRSFDLVATAPGVEVCDIASTPLLKESMDVVVYCLALMGTELTRFLVEANRVLKNGGLLLIAEVESRFENIEDFTKNLHKLGFRLKKLDKSNQVFYFLEFVKLRDPLVKQSKLPNLYLKPCFYKKR